VLYSPTHRARYAEFLRTEFPRIPLATETNKFERLAGLGWELLYAHLLREAPRGNVATCHGKGDHEVEFVRYSALAGC